jgi:aspartyl-tRNA(Asn)/glutamyl-tRNA(Gln) amidotransferase subunit B
MFDSGRSARQIVQKRGLNQISDRKVLQESAAKVIEENPQVIDQYRQGKTQVLGWLIGQVMRVTQGRADPQIVRRLLQEALSRSHDG